MCGWGETKRRPAGREACAAKVPGDQPLGDVQDPEGSAAATRSAIARGLRYTSLACSIHRCLAQKLTNCSHAVNLPARGVLPILAVLGYLPADKAAPAQAAAAQVLTASLGASCCRITEYLTLYR